jgi:F-type H+-transporting ATPase subunit gamma
MATLRDIKRRIKGVQSTQKITKAMKMVAAVKLRRAQGSVINARPYARNINLMFSRLVSEEDRLSHKLIAEREEKNIAVVVVTADRGLCGSFNTNIIKEGVRFVEELKRDGISSSIYCVGKKGFDYFSKRGYNLFGKTTGLFSALHFNYAVNIYNELTQQFLSGKFDKIAIIYNEFKSIIQQKIIIEQYLPIPVSGGDNSEFLIGANYIFEPSQKYIFEYLVPKHLEAQMWRVLLESNAAELGARMTAMDNATTNAKELIRTLQLKYNKERQAAITKEILEIVSGANALSTK